MAFALQAEFGILPSLGMNFGQFLEPLVSVTDGPIVGMVCFGADIGGRTWTSGISRTASFTHFMDIAYVTYLVSPILLSHILPRMPFSRCNDRFDVRTPLSTAVTSVQIPNQDIPGPAVAQGYLDYARRLLHFPFSAEGVDLSPACRSWEAAAAATTRPTSGIVPFERSTNPSSPVSRRPFTRKIKTRHQYTANQFFALFFSPLFRDLTSSPQPSRHGTPRSS